MIKKTIKYTDYNDKEQTGEFYFNLSKGELVLMEMSAIDQSVEGMQDKLERIERTRDGRQLAGIFKEIVSTSFGVKSHDGANFIKNDQNFAEFESSGAWSELIVELATDAEAAVEFINGLIPKNMRSAVKDEVGKFNGSYVAAKQMYGKEPVTEEELIAEARKRSESSMQGYQKKQETPKSSIEVVPELPASDPVFEAPKPDLNNMSKEELIAHMQGANA